MKVTSVNLRMIPNGGKLLGVASITVDNGLLIRDIKIIGASGKRFIRMPYSTSKNGGHVDVVHPITRSTRRFLEDTILAAYDKILTETPEKAFAGWVEVEI